MGLTANPLMKINLGHQEVDRLIDELIAVYQSTPVEWLTVKPIAQYLCIDLGYEDEGEFEDALNGTFIGKRRRRLASRTARRALYQRKHGPLLPRQRR